MMKILFAVTLVLLPLLTMGQEEDDVPATDISERYRCFVPGQCQVWQFILHATTLVRFLIWATFQEYSLNFKKVDDADACHKFAGKEGEAVNWWSFEPAQSLCVLFGNCTEAGGPDQIICPDCISGERQWVYLLVTKSGLMERVY